MVALLERGIDRLNVIGSIHIDLGLYDLGFTDRFARNRFCAGESSLDLAIYNDLPSYKRGGFWSWLHGEHDPFSTWYNSKGSEVEVYILSEIWGWLMENFCKYGNKKDVGAFLAGYSVSPRAVGVTDIAILTEGDRSSSGMLGDRREIIDAMKHLRSNIHGFEYDLGLSSGIKRLVGGGHTHPHHGIYLSPTDIDGMKIQYEFTKKHPELFAASGGNFELVVNPNDGKFGGFKLTPDGYEAVPISIVLNHSAMPRPMV